MSAKREQAPLDLPLGNEMVAARLDEIAGLLEAQDANPFRVRAYRAAAETLRGLPRPVHEILDAESASGLERLPGIGGSLARSIDQLAHTNHLGLLDRLRGDWAAEDIFTSVAGIGPELARRIHDGLEIDTLPELELAAHDGRLEDIPGMGRRRIRGVRESLAGRFGTRLGILKRARLDRASDDVPVSEVLSVDQEYLEKVRKGALPRIAPKRFNPLRAAWLPILHTHRGDRHYTALFSNTARAHELEATHDWVVIYRDDHGGHGQWTVITGRFGALANRRIVRGREAECEAFAVSSSGAD